MVLLICFMFLDFVFLGKNIHPYGIMCSLGIAISLIFAYWLAKRKKFEFFDFSLVVIITLLSALVGSKLLFIIVSIETISFLFSNYSFWQALLSIVQGGFVFYGGLIGAVIGLFLTTKIKKVNFSDYANIFALVLPLGHAFGRIGCFFAGCCYGCEYNGFLSYTYTSALDASTPLGIPLLPIQLIESASLFILFASMFVCYIKKKENLICYIYLLAYSIIRFVLEFYRGDLERGLFLSLSTSQWISLSIFITTLFYFVVKQIIKLKHKKISNS